MNHTGSSAGCEPDSTDTYSTYNFLGEPEANLVTDRASRRAGDLVHTAHGCIGTRNPSTGTIPKVKKVEFTVLSLELALNLGSNTHQMTGYGT